MSAEEPITEANPLASDQIDQREELPAGMGLLVFFFGLGAGLLSAFIWSDILGESLSTAFSIFVIALLVLSGIIGLVLLFRKRIIAYLFDVTQTHLSSFAEPLGDVARHAMHKDAEAATSAARRLVQLSLARYAWIATRRWIIASLTALIAAMAALGGTALLYRQNQLLATQTNLLNGQNRRLDEQNRLINLDINLAEAARNAELVVEISKISGDLATAFGKAGNTPNTAANAEGGTAGPVVSSPQQRIDPGLRARIIAMSLAIRPYRFLQRQADRRDYGERLRTAFENRPDLVVTRQRLQKQYGWPERQTRINLISRPTSTERGQLLAVLLKAGIGKLDGLNFFGLDLSYAKVEIDLIPFASFHQARLAFSDFSYAEIGGSNFGGAILDNAWFKKSTIYDTSFAAVAGKNIPAPFEKSSAPVVTRISGANFSKAAIIDSTFAQAFLTAAVFDDAVLSNISFANSTLSASTFKNSLLIDVDFTNAQLHSVEFDGAIVFDKDFISNLVKLAAPGTFKPERFIVEPIETSAIFDSPTALANIGVRINSARIDGKQAFRVKRVAPFEK